MKPTSLPRTVFLLMVFCLTFFAALMFAPGAGAQNKDEITFFPKCECEIFGPLVADPKEPRFFASIHYFDNDFRDSFTGASVGYGETFGLIRKNIAPDHILQLSIRGGLFSQFDMETSSYNLLNSDYTIGALLTYRYRQFALRLRAYHQSSHLGDEEAKKNPELLETATGFDYEAVDLLAAWNPDKFKLYAGPHFLVKRNPSDIDRWGYQAGVEYRGTKEIILGSFPVAGIDIKGFQDINWTPAYSLKAGVDFQNLGTSGRSIQIMAEYYNGFIPFGHYYDYDMESYGLGVYFSF
ncbi:MAG: DUF1207 domain-containing protein [Desulfobacterales bacterium]